MDPLATAQLDAAAAIAPTMQNAAWAQALWHIFSNVYNAVSGRIDGATASMIAAEIGYLNPLLKLGVTLLLLMIAASMMYGNHTNMNHLLHTMARIGIVMFFVGTAGRYQQWIGSVLTNMPTELGNVIMTPLGGAEFKGAGVFDDALNSAWKAILITYNATPLSLSAIFVYFVLGLAMLFILPCIGVSFLVWFIAAMLLKILVALGPLFVAAAMFPATKGWFDNWLGAVASAILTQLMVVAVIAIIMASESGTTDQIVAAAGQSGGNNLVMLQGIIILGLVAFIMMVFVHDIPPIAQRLTHGIALSVHPYTAAMSSAISSGIGATLSAARSAGAAGSAASRIGSTSSSVPGPAGRSLSGRPP